MERHPEVGYKLMSRLVVGAPGRRGDDRLDAPRAVRRQGVPAWSGRRGDPARGADRGDRRRLRRDHDRSRVPGCDDGRARRCELMRDGRGTQFDPYMLDLFLEALDETAAIAAEATERLVPSADRGDRVLRTVRDRLAARPPASSAWRPEADRQPDVPPCMPCRREGVRTRSGPRRDRRSRSRLSSTAFRGSVLASVYAVEHDRLWLVAQRGYEEVRDGFALDQGVMGRAVRTRHDPGRR